MRRHFTASVFVIDSQKRVLLLWHKKLQKWMPPGGHIDPDELPEDCAVRECKEETGIDIEIIGDDEEDLFASAPQEGRMLKKPFRMLLEEIPANEKSGEPAHQHMDFVFLGRPIDEGQAIVGGEMEVGEVRWFTKEEVELKRQEHIFSNVRSILSTKL